MRKPFSIVLHGLALIAVLPGCVTHSTPDIPTLTHAVYQQDWEAMQARFALGSAVDERLDPQNNTALLLLARAGRLDLVQQLLKRGANPFTQNQYGESALDFLPRSEPWVLAMEDAGLSTWNQAVDAIKSGQILLLTRLLRSERFYRYTPDRKGDLLSHIAVRAGCESCLGALAGADFDLHRVNPLTRQTPLMVAAQEGQPSLLQVLVHRNRSINQKDRQGWTALHFACGSGDINQDKVRARIVQRLLEHGARPDLRTSQRLSPLELAVAKDYTEVVRILLEHEAAKGKY